MDTKYCIAKQEANTNPTNNDGNMTKNQQQQNIRLRTESSQRKK